jgi:zinc transporter ZupT
MFDCVTKVDADRAQSARARLSGGCAVLGILAGTFLHLSGNPALGLANLLMGVSAGVIFLRGRKTHR